MAAATMRSIHVPLMMLLGACGSATRPEGRQSPRGATVPEGPARSAGTVVPDDRSPCADLAVGQAPVRVPLERPHRVGCANNPEERAVERVLRKGYRQMSLPSRVDISFDCDDLGERIDAIELVGLTAFQGGWVDLVRLERRTEDDQFTVRWIRSDLEYVSPDELTYALAGRSEYKRLEATVPSSAVDALIPRIRAALTASLREVRLPQPRGEHRTQQVAIGPVARHIHMRLTDSDDVVLEREATGTGFGESARRAAGIFYAASLVAGEESPLDLRSPREAEPNDADAALYERIVAWHDADERLFSPLPALAARFKTPAVTARILETLASLEPTEPSVEGARGPLRADSRRPDHLRAILVGALAERSGWDARRDDDGVDRPIDEVTADYLRACGGDG